MLHVAPLHHEGVPKLLVQFTEPEDRSLCPRSGRLVMCCERERDVLRLHLFVFPQPLQLLREEF